MTTANKEPADRADNEPLPSFPTLETDDLLSRPPKELLTLYRNGRTPIRQKGLSLSRKVLTGLLISILCLFLLMIREGRAGDDEGKASGTAFARESKTLSRRHDPVVILGSELSRMKGINPDLFGLYVVEGNRLVPIPFQVDQRDKKDKHVLKQIKDKRVKPPKPFDENDELVFMASDLGDRCSSQYYPPNWQRGIEIEVIDPLDGARGWSYLFSFDHSPERSERSYTRYLLSKEGKDVVDTNVFTVVFPPLDEAKADSPRELRIKPAAGGSGENIIDRNKNRLSLKLRLFGVKLNFDEDNIGCKLTAYKEGPVRIIRRTKNFIPLGLGLKSPAVFVEFILYETMMTMPIEIKVPLNLGYVLSAGTNRIGFDYSSEVNGSRFYNSLNLEGFVIDGKPTPEEENMNRGMASWNLLTGPMGTVMRRSVVVSASEEEFQIEQYLWDDVTANDPPESFPGNFGHTYLLWDFSNLRRGHYRVRVSVFVPPNFTWGDQYEYLNIEDNPLKVNTFNIMPAL